MQKESQKSEYGQYPFPWRIFIAYIVLSIIGIALIDTWSWFIKNYLNWMLKNSDSIFEDIFTDVLIIAIFIAIPYLLCCFCLVKLLKLFCSEKKIYSTDVLHYRMKIVLVICAAVFVIIAAIMVIISILSDTSYRLLSYVILFAECAFPVIMTNFLWSFVNDRTCYHCGLMNTYVYQKTEYESLGTERKWHTEGGYYENETTSGTISRYGDITPSNNFEYTTRRYVPKTSVTDGVFEKEKTDKYYKCCVCGFDYVKSSVGEHKISD